MRPGQTWRRVNKNQVPGLGEGDKDHEEPVIIGHSISWRRQFHEFEAPRITSNNTKTLITKLWRPQLDHTEIHRDLERKRDPKKS